MSTFIDADYDNAYNEYCRQNSSFPKGDCGEVLKNILSSNVATYTNMDYGINMPQVQNTQFFNCLKGIIGKSFGETVDMNDKLHIQTLTHGLFEPNTTYRTMHGYYNDIYLKGAASGYYPGWFSSPLVLTAYLMLQARETRLQQQQQPQQQQQQQQQYAQQQYAQQQPQQQQSPYDDDDEPEPVLHEPNEHGIWKPWISHKGGSRRRTVHKKRKSYRKSKSKRVRHTRRKQSRRHRHSRRRHH